jgi:PAS domain-containing protein
VPKQEQEHIERRLAQIQRLARIGFWEIDFASETAWWSDELYRIFGLEPDSEPPTHSTMVSLLHPDDLAVIDAIIARAQDANSVDDLVHRVVLLKDNERRIDLRGEVERDAEDCPVRLFGIGVDVTEKLATEEAIRDSESRISDANRMLQAVLDATPVRFFWKDLDLRYLGCNTNFATDAGFDRPSRLDSRSSKTNPEARYAWPSGPVPHVLKRSRPDPSRCAGRRGCIPWPTWRFLFPWTDPVYGVAAAPTHGYRGLRLGALAPRGETHLLTVPVGQLMRLRHNPFFPYVEHRIGEVIDATLATTSGVTDRRDPR